jgi:hypothetical protein
MTPHRLTDTEFHAASSDSKFVGYGTVSMAACDQKTRINWWAKEHAPSQTFR